VRAAQSSLSDLDAQAAALELDIREKEEAVEGLRTEKELQSGGEVAELQAEVDDIAKRWVGGGGGGGQGVAWGKAGGCVGIGRCRVWGGPVCGKGRGEGGRQAWGSPACVW
jgi:hypothetical protein